MEADPWGQAYRIVTGKIGRSPPGAEAAGRENEITSGLFPSVTSPVWPRIPLWTDSKADPPPFTHDELSVAASRLPSGESAGT